MMCRQSIEKTLSQMIGAFLHSVDVTLTHQITRVADAIIKEIEGKNNG